MTLRLGGDGAITGCTSLENPDLTVSGLTISGSFDAEKVLVSSGTAAAPSYTFSGDTDNGLYYAGTNSIGLSTAGTNALLIDSGGNVGVGTTSPTSISNYTSLTLNGTTGGNIEFKDDGTLKGSLYNTASEFILQAQGASTTLGFRTNSTERMKIDSSGNVGIGNTAPGYKLSVLTTGTTDTSLHLATTGGAGANGDATNSVRFTGGINSRWANAKYEAFNHIFHGNGVERMRIDSSGRVLIGHTSTSHTAPLQVTTATGGAFTAQFRARANNDYSFLAFTSNNGSEDLVQIGVLRTGASTGDLFFYTNGGSANGSERMRINSSGNVGIGTSSPGEILHCEKSAGVIKVSSSSDSKYTALYAGDSSNDSAVLWQNGSLRFYNTSERMRIDSSGRMLVGLSSPVADAFVEVKADTDRENTILAWGADTTSEYIGMGVGSNGPVITAGGAGSTSSNLIFRTADAGTEAERMRIANSGAVTVKRASTYTTGLQHGLAIQQGSATNGNRAGLVFKSLDGFSVAGVNGVISTHSGTQNNNVGYLEFYTKPSGVSAPVERMRIDSSGRWQNYSTDINGGAFRSSQGSSGGANIVAGYHSATSISNGTTAFYFLTNGGLANYQSNDSNLCDEREKKNIVSLDAKWDKVKSWELKKFHYNEDADTNDLRYGVIAQQIEEHCPEVLTDWQKQKAEDAVLDEDGNVVTPAKEEIIRKGVKEQQMMWMAIKALQEAMERIETLEAEVAELKNN